jgi:hypothetical protein
MNLRLIAGIITAVLAIGTGINQQRAQAGSGSCGRRSGLRDSVRGKEDRQIQICREESGEKSWQQPQSRGTPARALSPPALFAFRAYPLNRLIRRRFVFARGLAPLLRGLSFRAKSVQLPIVSNHSDPGRPAACALVGEPRWLAS